LLGYPGFITKFRGTDKVPDKPDSDTVDFENYRHVCHKWHYKENKHDHHLERFKIFHGQKKNKKILKLPNFMGFLKSQV
jgi:hypothetical protein